MPDVKYKITADNTKAIEALVKQNRELLKTVQGLDKVTRSGKRAGKAVTEAPTLALPAWLKLGGALTGIVAGLRQIDQVSQAAASKFQTTLEARQALASVAAGATPQERAKDLRRLIALTERISVQEGLGFTQAAGTVFAGTSAAFTQQQILKIAPIAAVAPRVDFALEAIKQFQTQFGAAGGTPMELLNKALAGARESQLRAGEFVPRIVRAASKFKGLGGTVEELIAAGVTASFGGPPEEQITQIGALASALAEKPEFAGRGLTTAIELLEQKFVRGGVVQAVELNRFFSERRARGGANILLENRQFFREQLAKSFAAATATGTPFSEFALQRRAAGEDIDITILRGQRRATARAERTLQQEARRETIQQSLFETEQAALTAGDAFFGTRIAASLFRTLRNLAPTDPSLEAGISRAVIGFAVPGEADTRRDELAADIGPAIAAFQRAATNMEKAAETIAASVGNPSPIDPNSHNE